MYGVKVDIALPQGVQAPSASLYPVQDIADDRPARWRGHGVLAENPVVVQRWNGLVFFLELDPEIDEVDQFLVAVGHGIGRRRG